MVNVVGSDKWSEVEAQDTAVVDFNATWCGPCKMMAPVLEELSGDYEGKVRDHLYRCFAGINVASILIDGSISACTSIRGKYYQGNIYKDDFWEVWNNGFKNYRDRGWMKKGKCGDCKMFRYCEGGGMHLRDEQGNLLLCHYERIKE